jgi:hypothetical protein
VLSVAELSESEIVALSVDDGVGSSAGEVEDDDSELEATDCTVEKEFSVLELAELSVEVVELSGLNTVELSVSKVVSVFT